MEDQKEIWDLKSIFKQKTEQEILEETLRLKKEIIAKKPLLKQEVSAELVLELIKLNESLEKEYSKIMAYYALKTYADINDEEASAKLDYYNQLGAEIDNETMFFELWFIQLDKEKAEEYIEHESLKEYKQLLKDFIKVKPHTKSEEVEQILNIKNITGKSAFSKIYDVFTSSFKYELLGKKELTQEEIVSKYADDDAEVREAAYTSVLKTYKENSNTLHELYKNIVLAWNNENQKIRKYEEPIAPRNLANNLSNEVVQTMLTVIKENTHLFKEYFKIKKEFLEKKGKPHSFSRFHLYAPYEEGLKEYSYEESKKICLETFKEFDEEFYAYAKKIFDDKHIHSHPAKGKRSGAFCYDVNNETTPYIMLNHTNKTRDLFTMMHELGHGVHDFYTNKNPNSLRHPVLPLAETASILAEVILIKKMLNTNNEEEKASLLIYSLDQYYATIMRQAYFVIFEEKAHKKIMSGATKKELEEEYYSLLKEQFGEMEIPDLFKQEWNYVPHIHHTPFYCYAYSWGKLLVLALYAEYEKNPGFKEKIKNILRAGATKDTLEIIRDANMEPEKKEFWEAGFEIIKKELQKLKELTKN